MRERQPFLLIDAAIDDHAPIAGVPGVVRGRWISGTWMTRDGATLEPAYAATVARAFVSGGSLSVIKPDGWRGVLHLSPTAPAELPILDFEGWIGDAAHWPTIIAWIDVFRATAPQLRIGFYPTGTFPSATLEHRSRWLEGGKSVRAAKTLSLRRAKPLLDRLDFLSPDFYLLGPSAIERDLAFIEQISTSLRIARKPIYAFVWGVWHDAFTPRRDGPPGDEDLKRYAASLRRWCDGAIVWGNRADNERLWAALQA